MLCNFTKILFEKLISSCSYTTRYIRNIASSWTEMLFQHIMQKKIVEQKRLGLSMLTGSKFLTARSKLRGRGGRASAGKMEGEGKVQHAVPSRLVCLPRGSLSSARGQTSGRGKLIQWEALISFFITLLCTHPAYQHFHEWICGCKKADQLVCKQECVPMHSHSE